MTLKYNKQKKKQPTNVFVMMKPEVDQVRKMMKKFWFFDLEI